MKYFIPALLMGLAGYGLGAQNDPPASEPKPRCEQPPVRPQIIEPSTGELEAMQSLQTRFTAHGIQLTERLARGASQRRVRRSPEYRQYLESALMLSVARTQTLYRVQSEAKPLYSDHLQQIWTELDQQLGVTQQFVASYLRQDAANTRSSQHRQTKATPSSRYARPSTGRRTPTASRRQAVQRRSYGCAENGSCYGDLSAATGNPKTVRVKGYHRKDGTYVRGHYRSR